MSWALRRFFVPRLSTSAEIRRWRENRATIPHIWLCSLIQLQLGVMDAITEAGLGPASARLPVDCGGLWKVEAGGYRINPAQNCG